MAFYPKDWPRQLRDHWTGRHGVVWVYNERFPYIIVAHDLDPAPKYFMSYRPDQSMPPLISDEVPQQWRPLMMAHEIYERRWQSPDNPEACLRATEFELARVPARLFTAYVMFRIQTWDALIAFAGDPIHGGDYTDQQRAAFRRSRAYLHKLLT